MSFVRTAIRKTPAILIPLLLVVSCEKVTEEIADSLSTFDTEYYEMEFTVKAGSSQYILAEDTISGELNDLMSQAGRDIGDIEEVILKDAEVSLMEGQSLEDFDMVQVFELTLYTDKLGEERVAWSDPVPLNTSELSLDLSEENLLPYFLEQSFILTSKGYLKQRVYEDVNLKARIKFSVKGRL